MDRSLNLTSIPDFTSGTFFFDAQIPPCPVPGADEFSPLYMICTSVISGIGIGVIGTYLFNFFFIKKRCESEKNDAQPHFPNP